MFSALLRCKGICPARHNDCRITQFAKRAAASFFVDTATTHNGMRISMFRMAKVATRNALCFDFFDALDAFVKQVASDQRCRAAVLKSDVSGVFCAGADLKERCTMTDEQIVNFLKNARRILCDLEALPVPVLAAIDGHALGGGLEVALACDLRVAADNARLGLIETKVGVIPGIGGTQRLQRLISPSVAKELVFTGRTITAAEAHRIGLVNHHVQQTCTSDAAYLRTLNLIDEMASGAPMSIRMSKVAMHAGQSVDSTTAMDIEGLCYARIIPLQDRQEGLRAFMEKRKPIYTGT